MNQNLSRRDFLKIAGVGLGALAFRPPKGFDFEYLSAPKRLPQFPESDIIGRVLENGIRLRSQPNGDDTIGTVLAEMPADTLVEWGRQVVGNVTGLTNQRFVETPQGYIYSSVLQPARNMPNTPISEMPAGQSGFWAEVTVPYVDLAHDGVVASPWMQDHISFNFPPRLYYGQVVWIDRIRTENGFVEYRWNEDVPHGYGYGAYGEFFWGDGAGFKVLTDADVAPINPDVDPNEKKIDANLDNQTLSCYEGNTEVYFCRISSGLGIDLGTGQPSDKLATPVGNLLTHWKIMSLNMTAGTFQSGYSTPAVPWSTMISGDGVAIHGAFWHNAFGEKRSHGCINVTPEDAKWIFRWTTPYVPLTQSEMRVSLPDHGTIVVSTETRI
ncbi:MAG TPA: L,D-transpeptidase [Anaerolineales bacterium]|nr:L,D-transpeptidase [Anaerolineales bacterium]